ncbi:complement component 3-1-like protein [Leptotrombidium deliense]|uniref:Complement component 3-1-like protein n=1 Tax=Leptotrombidium deliense TaxID=299467 RepID=A0A443SRD3_9ACAR|nr:complement component 3-1-like protein [Leptotrombidium deliense]
MLKDAPMYGKAILMAMTSEEERTSMVRVHSDYGFTFLQTDKPIYTPNEKVRIRCIRLDEHLKSVHDTLKLKIKNPQNIAMQIVNYDQTRDGSKFFLDHEFQFPPSPMLGMWHVIVSYGQNLEFQKNVSFEVAEYVLPTFSVALESPKYISPSTTLVTGIAKAFYVYGKPVSGIITFKFGIKDMKTQKITMIGRTSVKNLVNGTAHYKFSSIEFQVFEWFPAIRNHRFVVEATVIEDATGKREKQTDDSCVFLEKPYTISFYNSYNDFKRFDSTLLNFQVLDPFDAPAKNIPVMIQIRSHDLVINKTTDQNGEVSLKVKPKYGDTKIVVEVVTKIAGVPDQEQTSAEHTMHLHQSPLAFVIIKNITNHTFNVGEIYSTEIVIEGATYLFQKIKVFVVSRGRITMLKEIEDGDKFELNIRSHMKPHVRILAVAFNNNYFIADSVRLSVSGDNCGLKVDYDTDRENKTVVEPGDLINFKVEGVSGDRVALLGVDEAVYALRDKNILTKRTVINELQQRDTGCGVGGGLDAFDVVLNTGLIAVGFKRNELGSHCKMFEKRRAKREAETDVLVRKYDGTEKNCCLLGMTDDKLRRNCTAKVKILRNYLSDKKHNKCHLAFMECCKAATNPKIESVIQSHTTGVTAAQPPQISHSQTFGKTNFIHIAYEDEYEKRTFVRHDFRETWLFDVLVMNGSQVKHSVNLPHSITTWNVNAMSVSRSRGLCMLDVPLRLVSFKPIFIQVNLPFSVVKSEQIEMTVTVFNYGEQRLSVIVYMYGVEDVCSEAEAGEKSDRRKVSLDPNSAKTVAFPLVPLKTGKFDIKVVSLSPYGSDIVLKTLNVIPQGVRVENDYTFQLDPKNSQSRRRRAVITDKFKDEIDENKGIQRSQLELTPNHLSPLVVPNSHECIISAIADRYGVTVKTALSDLTHLIRKPQGCGEQTILFMAPTLFTLKYLDSTNRLTADQKFRAVKFLSEGYQRELMFRKNDGSYSAFTSRPASVWLTAFVMKIFCQTYPSLPAAMDPSVIDTGTKWLLQKQQADGSWVETTPVVHQRIMGGVNGQIPMTAFVSIALHECKRIENIMDYSSDFVKPLKKAEQYLLGKQKEIANQNNALVMALTAYSLTFSDNPSSSLNATQSLKSVANLDDSRNQMFWRDTFNIETAGYALLAIIHSGSRNSLDAQAVANYLNAQRSFSGSFDSSQDTVVALEALWQFSSLQYRLAESKVSLVCNITSHSRRFKRSLRFGEDNALVMQQFRADAVNEVMEFVTQGSGVGLMSVKLRYNVLESPEKLCRFDIDIKVEEYKEPVIVNVDNNWSSFFNSFPNELIEDLGIERNSKVDSKRVTRSAKGFFNKLSQLWPYKSSKNSSSQLLSTTEGPPRSASGLVLVSSFESRVVGNGKGFNETVEDDSDMKIVNESNQPSQNESKFTLKLTVCTRFLGKSDSEMGIIDVGILSGYVPNKQDLEAIRLTANSAVSKYEITSRSVIFYLDSIPFSKPVCIEFKIVREVIVANMQAAIVKVYDYYQKGTFVYIASNYKRILFISLFTGHQCSQLYSPTRITEYLNTTCISDVCECAKREICPQKKQLYELGEIATVKMISARDKLKHLICSSKYDFVWTGRIVGNKSLNGYNLLRFRIDKPLKGGESRHNTQVLTVSQECFTEYLFAQKEFIIFGRSQDDESKYIDNNSILYNYGNDEISDERHANIKKLIVWIINLADKSGWKCAK